MKDTTSKGEDTTLERIRKFAELCPSNFYRDRLLKAISSNPVSLITDGCLQPDGDDPDFAASYFWYNLLRKYPFKGLDRKSKALESFREAEASCKQTNERLSSCYMSSRHARYLILDIREKITRCLGRFDWNTASNGFAWGPGATTRLKNSEGDVYFKFRGKPETTQNNLPLSIAAIQQIPNWFCSRSTTPWGLHTIASNNADMLHVVAGSKITTVPKDGKTDRTIAIEPCMNMYIQKGIASMIRNRLRRVGVDLNDQSKNQELAKRAYTDGLCTIDISAASDSVSYKLVDLLLPDDWLAALKQCRSDRYILNSQIHRFEKFSTMGNGYTFELESLIFWAIAQVCIDRARVADRTCGIYGDDIIVNASVAEDLIQTLSFLGFSVNETKSFVKGPFYESCGKHYYRSSDVTPVFLKDRISTPSRIVWFSNSIVRWGSRVQDARFTPAIQWLVSDSIESVPPCWSSPIPDGVGDGGIIYPNYVHIEKGEFSTSYQRGVDFWHMALTRVNTRDRDPSDVPYLLRYLYRLEGSRPFFLGEPDSGIIKIERFSRSRAWCSSWTAITLPLE